MCMKEETKARAAYITVKVECVSNAREGQSTRVSLVSPSPWCPWRSLFAYL
jgi:hypothetical protein